MKKIVAMVTGLIILFSCASASEVPLPLPFGLTVGDSIDNVIKTVTNLLGEGEASDSKSTKRITYKPEQIYILGFEVTYASITGVKSPKTGEERCSVYFSLDANDIARNKDYSKLFEFYDSLCGFWGEPESSSYIISFIDIQGNITKESIFKHPDIFISEVSDTISSVEFEESWSNAKLNIRVNYTSHTCGIDLDIYVTK